MQINSTQKNVNFGMNPQQFKQFLKSPEAKEKGLHVVARRLKGAANDGGDLFQFNLIKGKLPKGQEPECLAELSYAKLGNDPKGMIEESPLQRALETSKKTFAALAERFTGKASLVTDKDLATKDWNLLIDTKMGEN